MNFLTSFTNLKLGSVSPYFIPLIFLFSICTASSAWASDDISCEPFLISILDKDLLDSLSFVHTNFPDDSDTIFYNDQISALDCSWNDFVGVFDIDLWKFHADNDDGNLHKEELPYAISIEGARNSPRNNYRRYIANLEIVAPTSGYVAFDWEAKGGDYPGVDAFYFTVNDSCVQLSRNSITSGHFVSWFIEKGDTISLEQTSNGTSNHITTRISSFQFFREAYQFINRTWHIVAYGDTTKCDQRIDVLRPPFEAFEIPKNYDGYDRPILSCQDDLENAANQFPYYQGISNKFYLTPNDSLGYSANFQDEVVSECGGNKTIKRLWRITDHCSNNSVERAQIIKVKDIGPIEMRCPRDQTFNISKCKVSVYIRKPKAWTACNEHLDVNISWIYGEGSKVYSAVTPGRYEIKFTAKDNCGLEKVCSMWLNLVYYESENVTCKPLQTIQLPASGMKTIAAQDLVNYKKGCSSKIFEVEGEEFLKLDCSDVGLNTYWIKYYDPAYPNDFETCAVEIDLKPSIFTMVCPEDIDVSCDEDVSDLSFFGEPVIEGNINSENFEYSIQRNLNNCGIGQIIRTWTIRSPCAENYSCSQYINVIPDYNSVIIEWPLDYTTEDCNGSASYWPDELPSEYAYPSLAQIIPCSPFTFEYLDQPRMGNGTCYSFERIWTALNVCEPNVSFTYTQAFIVQDDLSPVINAPENQIVYTESDNCNEVEVLMEEAIVTDCDPNVVVNHNSIYAYNSGSDASGVYPVGITTITFTSMDECGNESEVSLEVDVRNETSSDLNCVGELSINLSLGADGNASYALNAKELVVMKDDLCDTNDYVYAFSANINDTIRQLTCTEEGLVGFDIFRQSPGGSWEQCSTWVMLSDSDKLCNPISSFASVSGKVYREDGAPVKYVQLEMEGHEAVRTDEDGYFQIGNIPTGQTYEIMPAKEINIRNGINTLDMVTLNRHLLGTKTINSPYAIIACDLNNSNSVSVGDLYHMNGLVLGTITDLEKSWKFLPSDYTFLNPTIPFQEDFPGEIEVSLNDDMSGQDFIGIKSGDPNLTADPKKLNAFSYRNQPLKMKVLNEDLRKGGNYVFEFSPKAEKLIDGLQFTLQFDMKILEYVEAFETFGLNKNLVINRSKISDGQIGIVFLNYNQTENVDPIKLSFKILQSGKVSDAFQLTSSLYSPEAYLNAKPHAMKLEFHDPQKFLDVVLAPNPSRGEINIKINAAQIEVGWLEIIDIDGRKITHKELELNAGPNIYTLEKMDFENAGIYIVHIRSKGISNMQKVVIID